MGPRWHRLCRPEGCGLSRGRGRFSTPRFETGAESHTWPNSAICVGTALDPPPNLHYRIYQVL